MRNGQRRGNATGGTGRACGKVILLGEHAVVYGVPAIAVGIDRGARARAKTFDAGPSRLHVRGWNIQVDETASEPDLARALRALLETVRVANPTLAPLLVDVEADLPPGAGLGCSAAIGVAIARAIDSHVSDDELQMRAMAWERVFHGNPSGVDAAVAARGGCIFFRRGETLEPVRVGAAIHLCVGNTGTASGTRAMVDKVARLRTSSPQLVQDSFEAIRSLVHSARLAILAGDPFALGRLMDLNQTVLCALLLSTPDIEQLCAVARRAGALGAKLTGAGGGGSVVAIVPSPASAEAVLAAWRADGFDGFATSVAAQARERAFESESLP